MAENLTEEQRARLARLVRQAREAAPLSIEAAAQRGGMSHVTWGKVEKGEAVKRLTYAGIERSLQWRPGSIDTFGETGQEPRSADLTELSTEPQPIEAPPDDDAERLILESDMPATEKVRWIMRLREARESAERERAEHAREVVRMWRESRGA